MQAFFHRNSEALIAEAEHAMPVLPSIAAEYRARVGKTAQREDNGREIINQLTIAQTYTDPARRRPILPGSSLKGAIRTALLDQLNKGESPERGERNRALQQRLFNYRQFDQDPMRLVHIADAQDQSAAATHATEVRYAVNRKRHPVMKDGQEIRAQAENLRQVLECIPPLRPQAFIGQMRVQTLADMTRNKLPELRWTCRDIAAACNDFYQPILHRETLELRQRGYLDSAWVKAINAILAERQAAIDSGHAFLLRVGRHSGAESLTLNGVRRIKIMGARGQPPQYFDAAKTVWLAAQDIQQRRDMLPFGWVLVELAPIDQPAPAWSPAQHQAVSGWARADQAWHQRVSQRRSTLREVAAKQRAIAAKQAEQAAQAQREQEARAARLANLSDEARHIEHLRERLAQDRAAGRKEIGGELANQLVQLLKTADEQWTGAERAELADLAEEIHGFIGWPARQKKQARKEIIARLRAQT